MSFSIFSNFPTVTVAYLLVLVFAAVYAIRTFRVHYAKQRLRPPGPRLTGCLEQRIRELSTTLTSILRVN